MRLPIPLAQFMPHTLPLIRIQHHAGNTTQFILLNHAAAHLLGAPIEGMCFTTDLDWRHGFNSIGHIIRGEGEPIQAIASPSNSPIDTLLDGALFFNYPEAHSPYVAIDLQIATTRTPDFFSVSRPIAL